MVKRDHSGNPIDTDNMAAIKEEAAIKDEEPSDASIIVITPDMCKPKVYELACCEHMISCTMNFFHALDLHDASTASYGFHNRNLSSIVKGINTSASTFNIYVQNLDDHRYGDQMIELAGKAMMVRKRMLDSMLDIKDICEAIDSLLTWATEGCEV